MKPSIDELFKAFREFAMVTSDYKIRNNEVLFKQALDKLKEDLEKLGVAQLFDWNEK